MRKSISATIKNSTIKEAADTDGISNKNVMEVSSTTIHEPWFHFDTNKGQYSFVLPGNKHHEEDHIYYSPPVITPKNLLSYKEGDKIHKPPAGAGGRGGSMDGSGADDFMFVLSPDEYAKLLLEDLELPNREKRMLDNETTALKRAGYTMLGTPSNISLLRTMTNSIGRRIGLNRPKPEELEELEAKLEDPSLDEEEKLAILQEIDTMKSRLQNIPWIDPFDVRYNNFIPETKPKFKAVMFCLMDVSGSMGEREKDLAKRFYILLYRFLKLKYGKVEVVFIRHHSTASIVDEQTFFYGRESGGTVVSSAMEAMLTEIKNNYDPNDWNIYAAQCSDGDNALQDNEKTMHLLTEKILPITSYYAYIETARDWSDVTWYQPGDSDLWKLYTGMPKSNKFAMKKVNKKTEIYPVFRQLFSKKEE
jgi:uncharacterized sporulation protein YeaH/YhbH (DUF444 family)